MNFLYTFAGWSRCGSYNTSYPLVILGFFLILGIALSAIGFRQYSHRHNKQSAGLMVFGALIACLALLFLFVGPNSTIGNIGYCSQIAQNHKSNQIVRSPEPAVNENPQAVDSQQQGTAYVDSQGRFTIRIPSGWSAATASPSHLLNSFSKSSEHQYGHLYINADDTAASPQATYRQVYVLQNGQQAIVTNIPDQDGEVLYTQAPLTNTKYQVWCTYDHAAAKKVRQICEAALQSFAPLK